MDNQNSPWLTIVFFLLVVLVIGGGSALLISTRPEPTQITINPPVPTPTPAPSETPGPITVYVTGEVAQPETMVSIPAGSRVEEAINAAGGLTDNANLERVNLAAILYDGDQVHVPALVVVEAVATNADTDQGDSDNGELDSLDVLPTQPGGPVVHINTATSEQLQTLPNIGPALAGRIIAYRETNGPFTSLDDLDNVSGIGPSTLEKLRGRVAFD